MSACVFEHVCLSVFLCVSKTVYKYRTTKSHSENEFCDSSADWMHI